MGIIRFLLAISVVISHSSEVFGLRLIGGSLAVQAFYIISGFYMALILNEKYTGKGAYKLFITNRLLRLYPIYWIVLLFTVVFSLVVYYYSNGQSSEMLQAYFDNFKSMNISSFVFLIMTNISLIFQDMVMFLGIDLNSGGLFFTSDFRLTNPPLYKFLLIPQAWTIGLEITFYLIAPFIVRKKGIILILIFLSVFLRIYLYQSGFDHDPWTYRFFPTELVFFLLGSIAYHFNKWFVELDVEIFQKYKKKIYYLVYLFTLLTILGYSYTKNYPIKKWLFLFMFFVSISFIFNLSKKWKIDRYIGELSYPIYISHMLMLGIVNILDLKNIGVYVLILTIVFSIILNEFVAKKIEVFRQNRVKKSNTFS